MCESGRVCAWTRVCVLLMYKGSVVDVHLKSRVTVPLDTGNSGDIRDKLSFNVKVESQTLGSE